jgi:hypothetical protein
VSIHDAAAPALDTASIRTVESSAPKPIDPRGTVSVNGPLHGFGNIRVNVDTTPARALTAR